MIHEHVDYHVGLLRGFVLAHNAPTQILHALDVVLTDYRSKAGPLIGSKPKDEIALPQAPESLPPASAPAPVQKANIATNHFWTPALDEKLEEMWKTGASVHDISIAINKSPAAIYTRLSTKGLKRK